jgi:hypothetical protein
MIFQPCGGFKALGCDTKVGASVLMVVVMSSKFEKIELDLPSNSISDCG